MRKKLKDSEYGEFEIQSMLYVGILSMGYRIRGEVNGCIVFPEKKITWNGKSREARFDLVVFDSEWKAMEIIETKHPNFSIPFETSSQIRRYSLYGVPVRFAKSIDTALSLLSYYNENKFRYEALYGKNLEGEKYFEFLSLAGEWVA